LPSGGFELIPIAVSNGTGEGEIPKAGTAIWIVALVATAAIAASLVLTVYQNGDSKARSQAPTRRF
jgi:hypothetical protein